MDIKNANLLNQSDEAAKPQTPHELFNYYMQHPNEPITDADILNLKLDTGSVGRNHHVEGQEPVVYSPNKEESAGGNEDDDNEVQGEQPKASPYDILGA